MKDQDQAFNKMDKEVLDFEEIDIKDIKVNPDYFIFLSASGAIKALQKDNLKDGLAQFRLMVETSESIARGANRLIRGYDDMIKEFCKSKEYKDASENQKSHKLSNKKLELIMQSIGNLQTKTNPIKA